MIIDLKRSIDPRWLLKSSATSILDDLVKDKSYHRYFRILRLFRFQRSASFASPGLPVKWLIALCGGPQEIPGSQDLWIQLKFSGCASNSPGNFVVNFSGRTQCASQAQDKRGLHLGTLLSINAGCRRWQLGRERTLRHHLPMPLARDFLPKGFCVPLSSLGLASASAANQMDKLWWWKMALTINYCALRITA